MCDTNVKSAVILNVVYDFSLMMDEHRSKYV